MSRNTPRARLWRGRRPEQLPADAGRSSQLPLEVVRSVPEAVRTVLEMSIRDGRSLMEAIQGALTLLSKEGQQRLLESVGIRILTPEESDLQWQESCRQTEHLPEQERLEARRSMARAMGRREPLA